MKTISKYLLSILISTSTLYFMILVPGLGAQDNLDDEIKQFEAFAKVYQLIKARHYRPHTDENLIKAAIKGMVDSLDKHSQLMDKKTMTWLENQSIGSYSGIGITLDYEDNKFVVQSVIPDSPAAKSGLKPTDVIIKVNDISIDQHPPDKVYQTMTENPDQPLRLHFYHAQNPDKIIKSSINRQRIQNKSVEFIQFSNDLLIIRIKQFQKHTAKEITKELQQNKPDTIIIDLRNNPGGLLLSAIETAQIFVEAGKLVEIKDKNGNIIEKYVSRSRIEKKQKLFVLQNKHSASAAEILAGAIKDRQMGIVVGEKSYGKGTVQTIFPIEEELYIKLTTAKYYTASGISFDGVGVMPHHLVQDSDAERYSENDRIFRKAFNLSTKEYPDEPSAN